MATEINETTMKTVLNGEVIATATLEGKVWHVSSHPVPLDRNSAITALTLAERRITHGEDDPCVKAFKEELASL